METITRLELGAELAEAKRKNLVFSVSFTKKDGSKRKMRARWKEDVKNSTSGGSWANSPTLNAAKDYHLINVMDDEILAKIRKEIAQSPPERMDEIRKKKRKAWRSIPFDRLRCAKINGKLFRVKG